MENHRAWAGIIAYLAIVVILLMLYLSGNNNKNK